MRWSRKQVSMISFGTEIPRSILFVDSKIFALYRDQRLGKQESYLGDSHIGCVKLAQNLRTGEWVAAKIARKDQDHTVQEVEALKELNRLIARIPRNQEMRKGYIFEPLIYGNMANRMESMCIREFMEVTLSVLEELQSFHKTGFTHGDCGYHNFLFDNETKKSTIIDFESTFKDQKQEDDTSRIIQEMFQYLEFCQTYCNSIKNREELLRHLHIFDAVVKLDILMRSSEFSVKDSSLVIEYLKDAYDREFNSALNPKDIFPLSLDQQQEVIRIKDLIKQRYDMPVQEYVDLTKETYIKNQRVRDLNHLRLEIEEHKKCWRMTGKTRLLESQWALLSTQEKMEHNTACKERLEDRLLRQKNSCFWSTPEMISKERIIRIIGDFELLQEI